MNFMRSLVGSSGPAAPKAEKDTPSPDARDTSALSGLEVTKSAGDDEEHGAQASDGDRQSLWKTLSSKLGGDVSVGISLPVSFFEPTSTLQRMAEMLHFSEILDAAAEAKSPIDRLGLVAVFAVTNYNSTERFYKPFNPILGETFEFVDESKGVHLVGEQVSHHPPVSAQHCEGRHWVFWQDSRPTTRFNGNSIDIFTNPKTHIYIPRTRDHFVFREVPTTRVNNLIIGRSWIEHYGQFIIENLKTREIGVVTFDKSSWAPWRSEKHIVHGDIKDSSGSTMIKLSGRWNKSIDLEWVAKFSKQMEQKGTKKEMWSRPINNSNGKFHWTEFTHRLNEMATDEPALQGLAYEELLPRTDGRLRPDRLTLERGDTSAASRYKHVLEEKQRTDRKARNAAGAKWTPKWFHCIADDEGAGGRPVKRDGTTSARNVEPDEQDNVWVYCGDYWEQRQQRLQWIADQHAGEAESHSDDPSRGKRDDNTDSDGAAPDDATDTEKEPEPLGVLDLVGKACDFRSYE